MLDYNKVIQDIVEWIKMKVTAASAKGLVFGLSGGIDSAVVAALCKKAFPEDTLALILPCYSSEEDIKDAQLLVEELQLKAKTIYLDEVFDTLVKKVADNHKKDDLAVANIKPRLRMTTIYYYAQKNNYLVCGTGNKSEIMTGYFTKYGDGASDIEPIGHLLKTEVYELAKCLKIPEKIITKKPSAGLWEGQSDELEMGISYSELDEYLKTGQGSPHVKKIAENLIKKSEHKRHIPPTPNS